MENHSYCLGRKGGVALYDHVGSLLLAKGFLVQLPYGINYLDGNLVKSENFSTQINRLFS